MKNNNITPPHDLGAERAVLGSMLFTSDALINVMGILKTEDFYYKVPKGEYFVLGDNRGNSMDSRVFGSFKRKRIVGKTKLTIFPFNRFGNKE